MNLARNALATGLAWSATALVLPGLASAQQVDTLRARYLIELPPTIEIPSVAPRTAPGSSAGSPTAFGANWGDAFLGAGMVDRQRFQPTDATFRRRVDGAIMGGFGLGNARDLVGLEVTLASYSTFDAGFFTRSGVSLKLHRVLAGNWGVALGMENALTRGEIDADPSYFAAVSRVWGQDWWNPFRTITGTLGAGNGRFQFEEDMQEGRNRVNAFASVGFQVWEPVSLIADWTGQDLAVAVSLVPFRRIPLIITPGFADIIGTAGDGARFTLGAGVGFQFADLGHLFP